MKDIATNGGPAFPQEGGIEQLMAASPVQGMTLRDYFAAKAMQGFVSHPDVLRAVSAGPRGHDVELAEAVYALADVMLKVRQA